MDRREYLNPFARGAPVSLWMGSFLGTLEARQGWSGYRLKLSTPYVVSYGEDPLNRLKLKVNSTEAREVPIP